MNAFGRELLWDIRGNRLNATLSFIALFVAMLSLILAAALSSVGTDTLVARSEQQVGRAVTLQAPLAGVELDQARLQAVQAQLSQWPSLGVAGSVLLTYSMEYAPGATFQPGAAHQVTKVRLIGPEYPEIRRLPLVSGRMMTSDPYPGEVVVNTSLAEALGAHVTRLQLSWGITPATAVNVVGVVADGQSEPYAYGSVDAFATANPFLPSVTDAVLLARTSTPQAMPYVKQLMADAANSLTPVAGEPPTRIDTADQTRESMAVLGLTFQALAGVGLVVAIVGMVNVGLAGIRERARDFTIRRAMGATRTRVISSVTASTVVIGLGATCAAIVVSYLAISRAVPTLLPADAGFDAPEFPWQAVILAATFGLFTSLVSGLIPALKTLRFELASALRE
ncbi:FtsX-like permease family protein [Micrococcales bacterium 31B]|nr:FtsX-like permease family protein [Micrococcales bacterium 31B]